MATLIRFNTFLKAVHEKKHNCASDQFKIALTNAVPSASNSVLANISQISYTNCSSRNITTTSSTQSSGKYKLVFADLELAASGGTVGPFRYAVIYNDSASNKELVGYYDYGSSITLNDGETITIDFDGTNGVYDND